jgi:hypothetical protein
MDGTYESSPLSPDLEDKMNALETHSLELIGDLRQSSLDSSDAAPSWKLEKSKTLTYGGEITGKIDVHSSKSTDGGGKRFRVVQELPFPMDLVFEQLANIEVRKAWDPNIDSGRNLAKNRYLRRGQVEKGTVVEKEVLLAGDNTSETILDGDNSGDDSSEDPRRYSRIFLLRNTLGYSFSETFTKPRGPVAARQFVTVHRKKTQKTNSFNSNHPTSNNPQKTPQNTHRIQTE